MKMVAIRQENGMIYLDKRFFDRFTEEDLSAYGYTMVAAREDCEVSDFNDDLTFSLDKYKDRKQREKQELYEDEIVSLIRQQYNQNQEFAILRQRDSKPQEFYEYDTYVEKCKAEAKAKFNL